MVTPQFLLEGMLYALEQCGRLLREAVVLYRNGDYSTSILLAVFAREELGKSRILGGMRKEALGGKSFKVGDIKKQVSIGGRELHIRKQKAGQLSVVQREPEDSELGRLLRARHENHPHSAEYSAADKRLAEITDEQRCNEPAERHKLRMRCLYVEADDAGTAWNRPCSQTKGTARDFIEDAVNDYLGQYDRFQGGSIAIEDEELARAVQAWAGRPELPSPELL
jgi:AbiV family abortive infection protein